MYSFPNLEPVCCSMSMANCCFLTCIQIPQEAGQVAWYSYLFKNFPVCCDPHIQRVLITRLPQDWGNRLLEGRNKTVHTRTQEKGTVTPQETEPDLPVSVQECSDVSGRGVGWQWPSMRWGAPNIIVLAWVLLKEVAITPITPTLVCP